MRSAAAQDANSKFHPEGHQLPGRAGALHNLEHASRHDRKMVQMTTIPADEQENVLASFWTMLQECESNADNENNPVLKHWVVQWYGQWNRITGDSKEPRFVTRERERSRSGQSG
jgi:hypothetical protein